MYLIQKKAYSSQDWHDWMETTGFLESGENSCPYLFDDYIPAITKDLKYEMDFTSEKAADISKALIQVENGPVGQTVSIEGLVFRKNKPEEYEVKVNNAFYTMKYWYNIKNVTDPSVLVFLPIRLFICAPKLAPGAMRTECAYTHDMKQAKRKVDEMKDLTYGQREPFYQEEHTLLVGEEKDFSEDEWYMAQVRLNEILASDPERFWTTYHPCTSFHEARLGLANESE
jgi:hypothetical protein